MFAMSIMTVFCTTFVLARPAITMENNQSTVIVEEEAETYVSEVIVEEAETYVSEVIMEETETCVLGEVTLNENNQIMILSALLNGKYNDIIWELSPAVDGGYRLKLNADTPTEVMSDLFSGSDLSEYKNSISAVYLGAGINAVGDNAFRESEQLRTVEFENVSQLTAIGSGAFCGCTKLSNVNLEACTALTTLGEDSFKGTNLVQITIPSSVVSIGDCAFYGCANLNSVDFQPNTNLEKMGAFVFAKCTSLETINIENLTNENLTFGIKEGEFDGIENANAMFYNCEALKSLTLPNVSGSIASICRGCSSLTSLNLDKCSKLEYNDITNNANLKDFILGCMNLKVLDLSGVTGMTSLFRSTVGGGVKKVTLPPTLNRINDNVIAITSVEEIVFAKDENGKSQIACVENNAFKDATNLKEIDLQFADTGVPYLNGWAFNNCQKLEKIAISSSVDLNMNGEKHFTSCNLLNELIWNVKSVNNNITNQLVDDKTSKDIHFTVGENVEKLPSGLIEKLKNNISEYSFVPEHSFYIEPKSSVSAMTLPAMSLQRIIQPITVQHSTPITTSAMLRMTL